MERLRRRQPADSLLPPRSDQPQQPAPVAGRLDLRYGGCLSRLGDAMQPPGGGRAAVCHQPPGAGLRATRGHRQGDLVLPAVPSRWASPRQGSHSGTDVLERARPGADLLLFLAPVPCPGRGHRQALPRLRKSGSHRPEAPSAAAARFTHSLADHARGGLPGPAHPRQHGE